MNSACIKRLAKGAAAFVALAGITATAGAFAETFEDTFAGTTLNSEWSPVIPKAGASISVNGGLQITVPSGAYDDWLGIRTAPRVEIPAPDGDFTITTHLKSITNPDGSAVAEGAYFCIGFVIAFRENAANEDVYLFGPHTSLLAARVERTDFDAMESNAIKGLSVWLKVQRVGDNYHFYTRDEGTTDSDWKELQLTDGSGAAVKTMHMQPINIGLTLKKWSGDGLTATFDDFKLDATALKHNAFVTGTVNANGGDPTALTVQLADSTGRIVASSAPDASGKYSLAAVPGTYSVQIQQSSLVDSPAADIKKTGIVLQTGSPATADFSVHGLYSMSLASGSLPSGTGWKLIYPVGADSSSFDAIGSTKYDDSSDADVTVPSDVSGTIGTYLDYAYRLTFDVPDAMVGKDLLLNNFALDDGIEAAYFNGTKLGSSTEGSTGLANPWTYSQTLVIPGSLVKKTGNVLVFVCYQGYGGAGMTGNAPTLQTLSSTTGVLTGKTISASGSPILLTFKLLNSKGETAATVTSSGTQNGTYVITGLTPGTYSADPAYGELADGSSSVTVTAGQITTADINPNGVSLSSSSLASGSSWKLGVVNKGDYSAAADAFDDSTLADATVPGDIGTTVASGAYFVYRLKFDLPANYVGKDLVMTNFTVDDGIEAAFINNNNLGSSVEANGLGGPANSWSVNQTYVIPASQTKATGNVLAIYGYQGTGGVGITGGAPVIFPIPSNYGVIKGELIDSTGNPAESSINLLNASGDVAISGYSSGTAYGQFAFLASPGSYSLDNLVSQFSGAPTSIAAEGGKITDVGKITVTPYTFLEDSTARTNDDDFSGSKVDSKWTLASVGDATNSAASISDGVLNVADASSNIWNNPNDNFTYLYQSVPNGNYSATLQVVNVPTNRDWEVGGLMLRNSLDAWSAMGFDQVSPNYATQDKNRLTQDASATDNSTSSSIGSVLLSSGSLYVKMRKIGTRIAFFWTTDPTDASKTQFGHIFNITGLSGDNLLIGIASDSQNYEIIDDEFQYDNFKLVPLAASTTVPTVTLGDLNADSKVNVQDATISLRIAVGLVTPTTDQKTAGDVNKDGKLNVQDTTLILQVAVGIKSGF